MDQLVTVSATGAVRLPCIASPLLFMRLSHLLALQEQAALPLPQAFLAQLCSRLLAVLRELHRAGLTHGAVSPVSVLLTSGGGVSLLQQEGASHIATVYNTPPAGLQGHPAADLFALGALLFLVAEGQEPFYGETAQQLQAEYQRAAPVLRRAHHPAVARTILQLLAQPLDCQKQAMAGRLAGFESPTHGGSALEDFELGEEVLAGVANSSSSSSSSPAASAQRQAPRSPPPPPLPPLPQRQLHPTAAGLPPTPSGAAAAAAADREAQRLQRLARMREGAAGASSSAASAAAEEAALRAARIEAHAARMRLKQQFGGGVGSSSSSSSMGGSGAAAGLVRDHPGESAAVLIAQAAVQPLQPPSPVHLLQPLAPRAAAAAAAALEPVAAAASGAANPALEARAARLQARRAEEELALEGARRRAFQERQQLASKAKTMFSAAGVEESGLPGGGHFAASGAGTGTGAGTSAGPVLVEAGASPYSAHTGMGAAAGVASEGGGGSSLHSNLRAERLRRKQEEEEAALEAARRLAFAERMALQKKHGGRG